MEKKPKRLKVEDRKPADWIPPADAHVISAIKAMHAGTASAHQQQLALQWIVREAGGKAHFQFHGEDSHATAFALGRLFVADLIVGIFNADLSSLRRVDHVEAETRSS